MSNSLKKALTIAVSAMTAFWSVGVAAFAPLAAAAAPSAAAVVEGDLIKASLPAVYYVGANGKRFVFPNEKTYKTWWSNFSAVKIISDAELASIAIGGNVTYRPGARLVKITTDPKVYMVGADAELHPIANENTALELFGSNWNQKIDDVSDAFFTNYTVSSQGIAVSLGMGNLPVGTVVAYNGNVYLVGATENFKLSGDLSIYGAVVLPSNDSEFSAWVGQSAASITNTITASQILQKLTPDRTGTLEGGDGTTPGQGGVTVEVTRQATNLSIASASSQNLGWAEIKICTGGQTITIDQVDVTSASGTIGFNTGIHHWIMIGESLYEQTGTDLGDTQAALTASDSDASFSGCVMAKYYAATNATSGVLDIKLRKILFTASGSAAAAIVENNSTLAHRQAVGINQTDLMDIVWSSPTAPGTLQTDGTKQQIFSVQAAINNNDALIPNIVFKVNGSLIASHCELRIAGTLASTDYKVVGGKYYVFALPSDKQVQIETSKTWELWCNVDGEAGQTMTPSLQYPAPYFFVYDNNRVLAAAPAEQPTGKENVVPSIARILISAGAVNLAGASVTLEVVNLNNVKINAVALDDEKTNGTTNTTVAVFKAKVRGSKATLSALSLIMTGANAASGMTLCQVKIGQRTDHGEIVTVNVDLSNYSLSNYAGENNLVAATVALASTKQMQVGDWLIVVECDVTAVGPAYTNGMTMAVQLSTGAANISFDVGTTANFPTANTVGTTITIRLLTALTVAANGTARYLVANATDVVIGEFTITGPTQEGVNVTSIAVTFPAGIAGVTGCTTVTLENAAGTELSTSQSLTGASTLTFSVSFSIPSNAQYLIRVVCVQAGSGVVTGAVAGATTVVAIAGNGSSSAQSFNNTGLVITGATVNTLASGTVTSNVGQLQPAQILAPNETLKIFTISTSASIHEDQGVDTFSIVLTAGSAALATDAQNVVVKANGFSVSGVASAAEQTICTRAITGVSPVTITCNFNSSQVVLGAGQTGEFTVYLTGNTLGSIGNDPTPTDGILTPTLTVTTVTGTSNIVFKGAESQVLVPNTANPGAFTGRVVTPAGAGVRLVLKALPSTTLPGQANMLLAVMDLIISSTSVTMLELSGLCTSNDATVCAAGVDTISVELDDTVMGGAAAIAIAGGAYDGSVITDTLVTVGTHKLEVLLTDVGNSCSTGDTVQLTTNEFGFTVAGVPTVTQSFASAGAGAFPNNRLPDLNTFAGSAMSHQSNLCG